MSVSLDKFFIYVLAFSTCFALRAWVVVSFLFRRRVLAWRLRLFRLCFDEVHVKTLDFSCVDFTFSVVLFALFMFAFCFFGFAVLFVFSLSYSHLFVLYLPIISSNLLSICESLK